MIDRALVTNNMVLFKASFVQVKADQLKPLVPTTPNWVPVYWVMVIR